MDGARLVRLAIRQPDKLPLPIDVSPLNGRDLARAGAGEQCKPQPRSPERADLPFPLGLLDRVGRRTDFGFAEKSLSGLLAVHLDAARRIARCRTQAVLDGEVQERAHGGDRVIRPPGVLAMSTCRRSIFSWLMSATGRWPSAGRMCFASSRS